MKSRLATASFRWQEMDTNLLIFQGFFISLDCVLNNIAILVDTEKKTKNKLSQPWTLKQKPMEWEARLS